MEFKKLNIVGVLISIIIAVSMIMPVSLATDNDQKAYADVEDVYYVDFTGPVQEGWSDALDAIGVDIITYVQGKGYEVKMSGSEKTITEALPYVKTVSELPNEAKISPDIAANGNGVAISLMYSASMMDTVQDIANYVDVFQEGETSNGYVIRGILKDASVVNTVASFKDVHYISPYIENELKDESGMQQIGGFLWVDDPDSDPDTPYRDTGGGFGTYVNHLGWTGDGVIVGIADTGIGDGTTGDANHVDFENRVIGGTEYGAGDWADGHGHGTHCAGLIVANGFEGTGVTHSGFGDYYAGMGLAYDAEIYAQKIFTDAGGWAGPADYYTILEDAQRAGVMVHSNSWGGSTYGAYDARDEAYDHAVRDADDNAAGNQQLIITVAASNDGSGTNTIGSPGNAKNVITVGATENYWPDMANYGNDVDPNTDADNPDQIIDFSSRGWTDDNRIKPDVVAAGSGTLSPRSTDASIDCLYGTYDDDNRYEWCSGTSQANPTVAGGVAVIYEWYLATYGQIITPSMAKALTINTAVDIGAADIPNRDEGWGRMFLPTIMDPPAPFILKDEVGELTPGVTDEFTFSYADASEPLKITLAYTDLYATGGANPTLQNQVNLEIESPLGDIYHGNAFLNGWTPANTDPQAIWDTTGDGYDNVNNVECVYIPSGSLEVGQYTVRVIGTNILRDCDFDGTDDQDYSLVIYNAVDVSQQGTIDLDQNVYAGEDVATITVGDTDLNTLPGSSETVNININSNTEPLGETVTLTETGPDTSIFESTITLSATDGGGILHVSNGDTITATYNDLNDGSGPATVTDTATIDSGVLPVTGLTVEWWGQAIQDVYFEDFEGDGSPTFAELGWTTGGGSNDWEIDTPSGLGGNYGNADPNGAFSGTFSIGNDLTGIGTYPGDYEINLGTDSNYIYSPAIDCSLATGTTLYFQRYLNVEQPLYDHAYLEISTNGVAWNEIWANTATIADSAWGLQTYDISGWADNQATVYIRFEIGGSDGSWQYCGWNIDDVRVEALVSGGTNDNCLNWTLSGDDGAGADDVAQYNIYRADNAAGPWDAGALIDSVPAGTDTYTDPGVGEFDVTTWWYVVRAVDDVGNEDTNTNAVPEPGGVAPVPYDIDTSTAAPGDWIFVSFPITASGDVLTVLDDANWGNGDTTWEVVCWYDPADASDHWKTYDKAQFAAGLAQDMPSVDNAKGMWVKLTTAGALLSVGEGQEPTNTDITLNTGWNLIGYPAQDDSSYDVGDLKADTGATSVEGYGAGPYNIITLANNYVLQRGEAYWVKVGSGTIWTVDW